jgi:hypothetical protein
MKGRPGHSEEVGGFLGGELGVVRRDGDANPADMASTTLLSTW